MQALSRLNRTHDRFATAYLDASTPRRLDHAAGSATRWEKVHAELLDDDPDAAETFRANLTALLPGFDDGTTSTEQDVIQPFEEAVADPKVCLAAVAYDEGNFGDVFEDRNGEAV